VIESKYPFEIGNDFNKPLSMKKISKLRVNLLSKILLFFLKDLYLPLGDHKVQS